MKKKILNAISIFSLVLVLLLSPVFVQGINAKMSSENASMQTRTVSVDDKTIDIDCLFNEYDDVMLETDGSMTTFEGSQTIKLSELEELDEVSKADVGDEEVMLHYNYSFDYATDMVTLSVVMLEETEDGIKTEVVVDTIQGKAFVNDDGNIDAELDLGGEVILLSQLQDLGLLNECGWLKNAFRKIANAVKKVTQTTIGVIGTIATVAVPAIIGVACAATGVGLLATIAIGAAAGAAIASSTAAISTKQQDGNVDLETVGICAGVGAVVGAVVSGAAYGITKAVQGVASKAAAKSAAKQVKLPSTKFQTSKLQHEWKHAKDFGIKGNWNKANGLKYQQAIEKHLKTATDVYKSTYRGSDVYVYLNQKTGIGAYVDMAGNYVGGWKFTAEQIAYHITNGIKIIL